MKALGVRLAGVDAGAGGAAGGAGAPEASASQGAMVAPGAVEQVGDAGGRSLVARLTDPGTVGPGLLVLAGSVVAWVAARYIRAEQDRKAYRRQYARTWT
jgi:hypothetical protein